MTTADWIIQATACLIMAFVFVAGAILFALRLRERNRNRIPGWIEIHMGPGVSADDVVRRVEQELADHEAMFGSVPRRTKKTPGEVR